MKTFSDGGMGIYKHLAAVQSDMNARRPKLQQIAEIYEQYFDPLYAQD